MAKTLYQFSQQIKALAPDAVALDRAKQLGDLLITAKAAVKAAGKSWTSWLESDCSLTTRTAQRFMTIANRWDEPAFAEARTANPALAIREADKVLANSSTRKKAQRNAKPVQPTPIAAPDAEITVWGPSSFLETEADGEGVDFNNLFNWWMEEGVMPGNPEPYVPIHAYFESTPNRFEERYLPERIKREMQKLRFATLNYLIDQWLNRLTDEELDGDVTGSGTKLRDTPYGKDAAWKTWTFTREFGDRKGEDVTFHCDIKDIADMVDGIDAGAVDSYIHGHPDWTGRAWTLRGQLSDEQCFLQVLPTHPKAKDMKAAHKAGRPWRAGEYTDYQGREEVTHTYGEWEG